MVYSVARFDVSFGNVFLKYLKIILSPVKVAEGHFLGNSGGT